MDAEGDAPERARELVFDRAEALAIALMNAQLPDRWEPLRDLMLAGLESGGLGHAADSERFRTVVGELTEVALDARRHGGRASPT